MVRTTAVRMFVCHLHCTVRSTYYSPLNIGQSAREHMLNSPPTLVCVQKRKYSTLELLAGHEVLLDKLITEVPTCQGAVKTCQKPFLEAD